MSVFQPYIDTKKAEQQENEEDAEKPKSIFDREDLHKDPLDEKDWIFFHQNYHYIVTDR